MNTLTNEQVLQLAEQHNCNIYPNSTSPFDVITVKRVTDMLNAAFALGVAQEREECAKLCEEFKHEIEHYDVTANDCANAIRARSKA